MTSLHINRGISSNPYLKDSNKKQKSVIAPSKFCLCKDTVTFKGKEVSQKDVKEYMASVDDYHKAAELHNRVLYSFADPSSMAQLISDTSKRMGMTKSEIFQDIRDNMLDLFDKLTTSPVVVVEGTKLNDFNVLNPKKYEQVKDIYLNLLDRPEIFDEFIFDTKTEDLKSVQDENKSEENIANLKLILNKFLPDIVKEKSIVLQDPSDIQKLLTDEVIRALVIDKLEALNPADEKDPYLEDAENNLTVAENKFNKAIDLLKIINSKFNITMLSRVPEKFYDVSGGEKSRKHTPDNYYNKKHYGLREKPKNFYEAAFLKGKLGDIKATSQKDIVIVTPKAAANNIVEKLKLLNQNYLYLEDWLYDYCLGDDKTRNKIITNLAKVSDKADVEKIKSLASDLDNYRDNFIKIYDINKPENNSKLNNLIEDYSKINCMTEISKGYFLSAEEDAMGLMKVLLGLAIFGHVTENAGEKIAGNAVVNLINTTLGCGDNIFDSCAEYLLWKEQFGQEKAKAMLEETIAHSLTIGLPTMMMQLSPDAGPLQHLIYSNASAGSVYAIVIKTFVNYYDKLEELIQKGIKEVPKEVKDDPDKLKQWKIMETWKGYASHTLNRGEFMGLVVSQPVAFVAQPLMKLLAPIGGRPIVVALEGSLECLVAHGYLLMDPMFWNNFSNKMNSKFAKTGKAEMTTEEFMKMRKSAIGKMVESKAGEKAVQGSIVVAKHFPKKLANGIKKAYMGAFKVVSKVIAKPLTTLSIKILEKKYNKQEKLKEAA